MPLLIHASQSGPTGVVALTGRLDGATASQLDEALQEAIKPSGALVIDMAGLDYVSSAGLRILLKGAKQAKAQASSLALCAMNASIREVFDISGFSTLFAIHPDCAAAEAALR